MPDKKLKSCLSPEQYRVTQEGGTELPFKNAYWNNKKPGIYVDVVSGEPLFSSKDKFDSGTGWPSFTQPIESGNVVTRKDETMGAPRTEVRSKKGDSHLGHVFNDGPAPMGMRYCINSASLKFIPVDKLEEEGYGKYLALFDQMKDSPKHMKTESAAFAAGCFWGVQSIFDHVDGVLKTEAGYTGGATKDPSYEDVCSGSTGHAEAVRVEYDPSKVSYEELLDYFWRMHDPTQGGRQGPDVGDQYRSVIFYSNPEQQKEALASKALLSKSGKVKGKITTQIVPATEFYRAEEYHQKYFKKTGRPSCHILRPR